MKIARLLLPAAFAALSCAPAFAQPGTWSAADKYYGAADMQTARAKVQHEMGGQTGLFVMADRLEYQSNDGSPALVWDGEGWYGGDVDKLWVKSQGAYDFSSTHFKDAELQALWARAMSRYFDFQAGVRRDFSAGRTRNFGVIGFEGLAPYLFHLDGAMFVSGEGKVSARIEAEYEFLLTQRLILQPRTELNFAAQSDREFGVGGGLSTAEMGLRLRYEIRREIAPYIGLAWSHAVGETAQFSRANGDDPGAVSFVAGLRLWF